MNECNIVSILSFPRCGTHFLWGAMIKSNQYQLIYDADRIPALEVLSRNFDKPIECLCLQSGQDQNPNYNFQYNSLVDWPNQCLSARQHLAKLDQKYRTSRNPESSLFDRILQRQDNGSRALLSVNRFIYTTYYDQVNFGVEWTTDNAIEALSLFLKSMEPYRNNSMLVIREHKAWAVSRLLMMGDVNRVEQESRNNAKVVKAVAAKGIPIFFTHQAIGAVKAGHIRFWEEIEPIDKVEIERYCLQAKQYRADVAPHKVKPAIIRPRRLFQYLIEKDPYQRLALSRSIGHTTSMLLHRLPFIGHRLKTDLDGAILNNARITPAPE